MKPLFIETGSPWENGYSESFNGKLRDELLNRESFMTPKEAEMLIGWWRCARERHGATFTKTARRERRSSASAPEPRSAASGTTRTETAGIVRGHFRTSSSPDRGWTGRPVLLQCQVLSGVGQPTSGMVRSRCEPVGMRV